MSLAISLMEAGRLPDRLIEAGIRKRLRQVLAEQSARDKDAFLETMKQGPIAIHTMEANEQHYELPPEFFHRVLGPRLKYSSCYYPEDGSSLGEAEEHMLALTCERAELADGMQILELGCGWGSLTLWMAEQYPHAKITAVSNSHSQRGFIEARAAEHGFDNVTVITADMNDVALSCSFDRVVSVEMFEHMRNYQELLRRVSSWLKPEGKLFVHIFTHRDLAYPYEVRSDDDWMAKYFFTGGIMPSHDVFSHFNNDLVVEQDWVVNGRHYGRTLRDWLALMDAQHDPIMGLMADTYGNSDQRRWYNRWRVFFLACAELFEFDDGETWRVSHYRLSQKRA